MLKAIYCVNKFLNFPFYLECANFIVFTWTLYDVCVHVYLQRSMSWWPNNSAMHMYGPNLREIFQVMKKILKSIIKWYGTFIWKQSQVYIYIICMYMYVFNIELLLSIAQCSVASIGQAEFSFGQIKLNNWKVQILLSDYNYQWLSKIILFNAHQNYNYELHTIRIIEDSPVPGAPLVYMFITYTKYHYIKIYVVCLSVRREVTGSSLTLIQKLQLARDTGGWRLRRGRLCAR